MKKRVAKYSNTVHYNIETTLDSSGVAQLQAQIRQVETELQRMASQQLIADNTYRDAQSKIAALKKALNDSFNTRLGMLDMTKFTKSLSNAKASIGDLGTAFSTAGSAGNQAFISTIGQLGKLDTSLRTVSSTTDKIFNTIGNTARWGVIASGFQGILNSVHQATQYVRDLDTSLTNIMMVTENSRNQMNEYAKSANEVAKSLGSTTVAMTDATLVFAQQGFNLDQSQQLAEMSTTLANVSQQDTATTSDQITAYMNAYGMDDNMEQLQAALDSWAKVANVSAADVEELATATQKSASTANTVGVNMDQLAAQIATIQSVTREAPENIGNGLKTIYARMSDIGMGETLDDGVNLGQVTQQLEQVGVAVLDSEGKMRDVGDIMEDLMDVWSSMDTTQKAAVGATLAGKYQLSRFEALMNRSDLYAEYKDASMTANGEMEKMQEVYADSLEGRLNKLQATMEGIFNDLFNTDDFYGAIDALTQVLDLTQTWISSIGGASNALSGLGAIALKVFSQPMARGLENFVSNRSKQSAAKQNRQSALQGLQDLGLNTASDDTRIQDLINFTTEGLAKSNSMSEEQQINYNKQRERTVELLKQQLKLESQIVGQAQLLNLANDNYEGGLEENLINLKLNEQGILNLKNTDASKYYDFIQDSQDSESIIRIGNEQNFLDNISNKTRDVVYNLSELKLAFSETGTVSGKAFTEAIPAIDALEMTLKDMIASLNMNKESAEGLLKLYDNLKNSVDFLDNKDGALKVDESVLASYRQLNTLITSLREAAKSGGAVAPNQLEEMRDNLIYNESRLQANQGMNESYQQQWVRQDQISSLINATAAIGQLAFAWQSFQSLGSIWSNADLELGDKILQTIMALGTALPMVLSSIGDLKGGIISIIDLFAALNPTIVASAASTGTMTAALGAETGAATAATVATNGFGAALKAAFPPLLAISAAIGLVVGGASALISAYNADADAAAKATENANKLSEAYNNTKTAQSNFENNLSAYNTAKQELSGLTKGTDEYNAKLKETNDQLLQMLETYPELAKYVSRTDEGVLNLSEVGIQKLQEAQEQAVQTAQMANTIADVYADQANQKASETSLTRSINYIDPTSGVIGSLTSNDLDKLYSLISEYGEQSVYQEDKIADLFGTDVSNPLVKAITESADKIVTAYQEKASQDQANQLQLQEAALTALQSRDGFDLTGEQANEVAAAIGEMANPEGSLYQEQLSNYQAMSTGDMARAYAEALGNNTRFISADWAVDSKGENAQFQTASGEAITVSRGVMEQFLAGANAMDQAASKWSIVADNLNSIANSDLATKIGSDQASSLLAEWKSGEGVDLSGLSGRELNNLLTMLSDNGGSLSVEQVFGDMSTEDANEWARQKGFSDAQAYVQAFSEQLNTSIDQENAFENILARDDKDLYTIASDTDKLYGNSNERYSKQRDDILAAIDSVKDLDKAYEEDLLTIEDYNKGLQNLGSEYEDLGDETNTLKRAQEKYSKALKENGKDAEKTQEAYYEMVDAQGELKDAIETKEWEKARDSLANYTDILENGSKESQEYQNAIQDVSDGLSDLTGLEVSTDWVEENKQAVNDWLNGVEGAGAKLNSLIHIDTSPVRDELAALGVDYTNLRSVIANNQIVFNAEGYADFSQVNEQLGIVQDTSNATTQELALLGAYLNAMGGASLILERNGESLTIPAPPEAPDTSGMDAFAASIAMGTYTASMNAWTASVNNALQQGWSFKGIDLPDSGPAIPKASPSGKGSSGGGGSGGGGRGGGGGSGGSGGGSSYTPQKKDPIEEEIDRYERVNTMIDAIANDLDRVADEQDRLAGFEVIDNMEKQIELIQRQIELQKEKLSIQQQEQKELRNSLASDYGIQFDSEGFITNYAQIHQKLTDEVNRLINKYNSTTTESGQESLEKQIEKAQDKLDDFKDDYQRYDELVSSDMKDTLQTLEDLEDQIEDIRIEAFQTSVEAADNIKDIQEALNEFNQVFSGLSSDDPFRQMALSVANLTDYFDVATTTVNEFYDELIARTQEQMGASGVTETQKKYLQSQIDMMKEAQASFGNQTMEEYGTGYLDLAMTNLGNILDQINQYEQNGVSSIFGENAGDLYETAKDVFDQTTEMIEDYEDEIDDLRDAILDAIDEIADEMDRRVEQYENITDELEHQRDIIELIHGDEAYTQLNEALAAQQHNYRAQINEMQQQLDIWKDMQSAMEEGSEEWLAIQELITDTQSDLNDLVQESLENLQEQYENTVNNIMNSWVDSALGTDLDWMNDQWELINRNADYYLDDVNAAYEIQKLQGDYLELLDGSNDVKIQQMITEQMKQQLGYLRDKEKLSEYDVAYAQAQLEILQKRIALEEAQRNKSQMKLRRDSQGNYSYVYTADEGDVANAQEGLLDAQNNAYNLSKDQMKQTQDDSLSALSDAQQMLNDIWTNANLTLEEKQERTRTIIDSLKEYLAGTSEQLSTSEKNIINDFIGMVEMMTDENGERLDDVYNQIINGNLDAFDQIDTRWSTSLTQWLQNLEDFNASTDNMFGNLVDNANDYQDQIDEVGDLVETDFNDMSDSIQNAVDKTNDLSNSTSDFINQLKNDSGTIKEYENILQDYADKISDVTNEMRAYQEQVNDLADKLTAKEQENANLQTQIKDLQNQINGSSGGSGGSGGSSFGGSGYSKSDLAWGIAQNIWTYGMRGGWGNDPTRSGKLTKAYGSDFAKQVQSIINQNYRSEKLVNFGSKKFSSYNLLGYDTGGYTGSWSDGDKDAKNGKLAYLHQKELVLNESDTKNLLNAVDIVRQLTQSLKSSALQESITNLSVLKTPTMGEKKIKQDVHITAEFPNANSATEIEQALLSLNDRAIQYSFKK